VSTAEAKVDGCVRHADTLASSPHPRLAGTVEAVDDPVAPALDADAFEALAKATRARS
jgi:hypothetical protein